MMDRFMGLLAQNLNKIPRGPARHPMGHSPHMDTDHPDSPATSGKAREICVFSSLAMWNHGWDVADTIPQSAVRHDRTRLRRMLNSLVDPHNDGRDLLPFGGVRVDPLGHSPGLDHRSQVGGQAHRPLLVVLGEPRIRSVAASDENMLGDRDREVR